MPKDTFFHLNQEKRDRIYKAALEELISVPISDVSINHIVQKAKISRGSFYQYFEDKQDLIVYVLDDAIRFIKREIKHCIHASEGDLFAAATLVLEGVFSLGQKEKYRKVLRNLLVESGTRECSYQFLQQFQQEILQLFEQEMDKEILCLQEENEYQNLAKIVFIILKEEAISYLYDQRDISLHREEFRSKMNMIKKGVLRKE